MPSHAPRSPADRRPAAPIVQAKAVKSSAFGTARQTDTEQRPAAPVGPKIDADAWHGFSFADVPVHAPAGEAPGRSGLPEKLKAGVEQLSGFAMDDVRVHRDSHEPAKLGALAYTRGGDIHLGPGQEQHLPHEAWHVVQQKQGRVAATTQLKGVGLNEDARLEAEADRMGENAALCRHRPRSGLQRGRIADGVVQGKILHKLNWLTLPPSGEGVSETIKKYVAADKIYWMRDDFAGDLSAKTIHLVDDDKRYLLGEQHYSGVWEVQTQEWCHIDKMGEQFKAIPPEKEDAGHKIQRKRTNFQEQVLESSHAWVLLQALQVENRIKDLFEETTESGWRSKSVVDYKIGEITDEFINFDSECPEYERFVLLYERNFDTMSKSLRLEQIYEFSNKFIGICKKQLVELGAKLNKFKKAYPLSQRADAKGSVDPDPALVGPLKELSAAAEFLPILVRDVTAVIGIGAADEEGKKIESILGAAARVSEDETYAAANPARERGMADRIKAASPPLLVQLGNDHVEPVAKLVGASAVGIDIDSQKPTLANYTETSS